MNKKVIVILIASLMLNACANTILFEETTKLEQEGWDKNKPVVFDVAYVDTSQIVDVGMTFIHSNEYAFSNLWLFMEVNGPEGLVKKDTLELFFAHNDGRWLGKKKGKAFEISALYQYGVKLSKLGDYSFSITQGMRSDQLMGIEDLSFWIQKSKALDD